MRRAGLLRVLNHIHPHAVMNDGVLVRDVIKEALAQQEELSDSTIWKARALQAEAVTLKFMAQPEQEPVAWMYTSQWKGDERFITRYQSELTTYKADEVWPLYTSPPPAPAADYCPNQSCGGDMNTRILELVNKVDRIKDMYEVGPVQRAAVKDFVDLIVRECTNIVLHYTDVNEGVAVAKKHFGIDDTLIKVGDRIKVIAGFNVGAKATVNYIEPTGKLWVCRDGANSDVFYYPEEVMGIDQ